MISGAHEPCLMCMTFPMPNIVIAAYLTFLVVCFGWRAWYQWRKTGQSGLRGIGRADRAPAWCAGLLLVAGHGLVVGYPVLAVLGWTRPVETGTAFVIGGAAIGGAVLMAAAIVWVIVAQLQMGASWRIAVDSDDRTSLVEHGLFTVVRNPIFTGVIAIAMGAALLVARWPMWAGVGLIVAGIELQVRAVEEPYLSRVHGASYARYVRRVGRFVPGLGMR